MSMTREQLKIAYSIIKAVRYLVREAEDNGMDSIEKALKACSDDMCSILGREGGQENSAVITKLTSKRFSQ